MKRIGILIPLLWLLPSLTAAEVPPFVTYSGRLTDGTGWGASDTVDLTIRVYDAADEGSLLIEQAFAATPIDDGYFSVVLTDITDIFVANDQTWVAVCVGADCTPDDELLPRQTVGSVPYSSHAERATGADRADLITGRTNNCPDLPCSNADYHVYTSAYADPDPNILVNTQAFCTQEYPIPVDCACGHYVGNAASLVERLTYNWNTPSSWESPNEGGRALCSCTWRGWDPSPTGYVFSRITCRRR